MTSPTPSRIHAWVLAGALAWVLAGLAFELHLVLRAPLADSIDVLYDDAYYYLGVAWNLAHRHRSMFTEPLDTNGYHPLWLLLLTGLTIALDLSKQALVVATLVFSAAVKCAGLCLFDRGRPDAWSRTFARIGLVLCFVRFPYTFSLGMETTLFIVFIPWLLQRSQAGSRGDGHALGLGLLAGLVFLTRLDALALDAVVLAAAMKTGRLTVRQAAIASAVLLATLLAYAAVNQHFFGTPVPVSGQAKAIGSHFGANLQTSLDFLKSFWLAAILLAAWAVARLTVAPALRLRGFELACLGLAAVACALYYGLMSGWAIWNWYTYPVAFFTVYASIAALVAVGALFTAGRARLAGRPRLQGAYAAAGAAVVAIAVVGLPMRTARSHPQVTAHLAREFLQRESPEAPAGSFNRQNAALVDWLVEHRPRGAVIAMGDRAGGLGYWMPGGFQLLQTEGLVGDRSMLSALRSGSLEPYLAGHGVGLYVVDRGRAVEADGVLGFIEPVQPRVTDGPLSVLCFRPDDALLSQDYLDRTAGPQLRRVFNFHQRVPCPAALMEQVDWLKARYDGVNRFSGL